MSAQRIKMEDEQIEAVKNWPKPKLMRDIQVFLGFDNFYRRFIKRFSKIAGLLTSMLRTSSATKSSKNLILWINVAEVDNVSTGDGGDYEDETFGKLLSKNSNGAPSYLTPDARQAFTQLRQAFTKAPILRLFDPKYHIPIETNTSGYTTGGVLGQLIISSRWQPVAYYLPKIISAKTWYKTYDGELLAIIEASKHGDTT